MPYNRKISRPKHRFIRPISFVTALFFLINNTSIYSAPNPIAFSQAAPERDIRFEQLTLPSELANLQEVYQLPSKESRTIILIQDAHAIPDAQRSVHGIIDFFQKHYGVHFIAVEGAPSKLDTQILKSFPDKELLKKILAEYSDQGELTGSMAAAILDETPNVYQGVENWQLYEQGLRFYLAALEKEVELLRKLHALEKELEEKKKSVYSKELYQLDQALSSFLKNRVDLIPVLNRAAKIQRPEKGTELEFILEESEKDGRSQTDLEIEVKEMAEEVKAFLSFQSPSSETRKRLSAFHKKFQEFQTSQIAAEAFALFLQDLTAKNRLPIKISAELFRLMKNQKRMKDIEGTRFFEGFEHYVNGVKESLFRNQQEKEQDQQSRKYEILNRLIRLELSRRDWEELKRFLRDPDLGISLESLQAHIQFYENAEKRDAVFINYLLPSMQAIKAKSAIFVVGGFHAEGLMRQCKEKNISCALLMPNIIRIPEHSHYREHMNGEVSWKDYLQVESGKINLYKAFVRGVRDKLIKESKEVPDRLLKNWRDQIVRDLAREGKISKANEYTPLIDEVFTHIPSGRESFSKKLQRVDEFIEGLRRLEDRGQLKEQNILQLLKSATMVAPYSNPTPESVLSADLHARFHISESGQAQLRQQFSTLQTKVAQLVAREPEKMRPAKALRSETRALEPNKAEAFFKALREIKFAYRPFMDEGAGLPFLIDLPAKLEPDKLTLGDLDRLDRLETNMLDALGQSPTGQAIEGYFKTVKTFMFEILMPAENATSSTEWQEATVRKENLTNLEEELRGVVNSQAPEYVFSLIVSLALPEAIGLAAVREAAGRVADLSNILMKYDRQYGLSLLPYTLSLVGSVFPAALEEFRQSFKENPEEFLKNLKGLDREDFVVSVIQNAFDFFGSSVSSSDITAFQKSHAQGSFGVFSDSGAFKGAEKLIRQGIMFAFIEQLKKYPATLWTGVQLDDLEGEMARKRSFDFELTRIFPVLRLMLELKEENLLGENPWAEDVLKGFEKIFAFYESSDLKSVGGPSPQERERAVHADLILSQIQPGDFIMANKRPPFHIVLALIPPAEEAEGSKFRYLRFGLNLPPDRKELLNRIQNGEIRIEEGLMTNQGVYSASTLRHAIAENIVKIYRLHGPMGEINPLESFRRSEIRALIPPLVRRPGIPWPTPQEILFHDKVAIEVEADPPGSTARSEVRNLSPEAIQELEALEADYQQKWDEYVALNQKGLNAQSANLKFAIDSIRSEILAFWKKRDARGETYQNDLFEIQDLHLQLDIEEKISNEHYRQGRPNEEVDGRLTRFLDSVVNRQGIKAVPGKLMTPEDVEKAYLILRMPMWRVLDIRFFLEEQEQTLRETLERLKKHGRVSMTASDVIEKIDQIDNEISRLKRAYYEIWNTPGVGRAWEARLDSNDYERGRLERQRAELLKQISDRAARFSKQIEEYDSKLQQLNAVESALRMALLSSKNVASAAKTAVSGYVNQIIDELRIKNWFDPKYSIDKQIGALKQILQIRKTHLMEQLRAEISAHGRSEARRVAERVAARILRRQRFDEQDLTKLARSMRRNIEKLALNEFAEMVRSEAFAQLERIYGRKIQAKTLDVRMLKEQKARAFAAIAWLTKVFNTLDGAVAVAVNAKGQEGALREAFDLISDRNRMIALLAEGTELETNRVNKKAVGRLARLQPRTYWGEGILVFNARFIPTIQIGDHVVNVSANTALLPIESTKPASKAFGSFAPIVDATSRLLIGALTGHEVKDINELNNEESRKKIIAALLKNHPELLKEIPNIIEMIQFNGRTLAVDQTMLALVTDYIARAEVRKSA